MAKLTLVPVETDGDALFVPSKDGVSEPCLVPALWRFRVEAVSLLRSDENDCWGRRPLLAGSSSSAIVSSLASLSPSSSTSSDAVPGLSPCPEPSLELACPEEPFPDVCSGYVHSLLPLRHPTYHGQSLYYLINGGGKTHFHKWDGFRRTNPRSAGLFLVGERCAVP